MACSIQPNVFIGGLLMLLLLDAGIFAIAGLLVIILLEAVVLYRLGWGNLWKSLLASVVVNFLSTFAGIFFSLLMPGLGLVGLIEIVLAWGLSILFEGASLTVLKRLLGLNHTRRLDWKAAAIANCVSYILLLVALLIIYGEKLPFVG